jgi:hypothetical protein
MSVPSQADLRIIDIGAPSWCWSQLGTEGVGILSYGSLRGRLSLAVPYAVRDRQITIPMGSFNAAGWLADGVESRLEVSGLTPDGLKWVVRATGTPQRLELPGRARSRWMHPSNGVGDDFDKPSDWLVLWIPRVRGFYETGLDS